MTLWRGAGWAVFYAVLVGYLTWPLAGRLATHLSDVELANRFDTLESLWVLSWESHALATHPLHLLDANVFHPTPRTLFYGSTEFGALPYFAPAFLLTGNPVLAGNILYLVGLVLTALCTHLVVARWTGSHAGGFAAAWTVLLNPFVCSFVAADEFLAVMQYFPLIAWLGARPALSPRATALLGVLIVLQMLVDPLYYAAALAAVIAVVALVRLVRRDSRRLGLRLLAVLGVSLLAMVPVYGGYLAVVRASPDIGAQTLYAPELARPVPMLPRFGVVTLSRAGLTGNTVTAASWVTLAVIGLGLLLHLARPRAPGGSPGWFHGTLWLIVGLTLSTGEVQIGHDRTVLLPHAALLQSVHTMRAILRGGQRLGIVALFGFAILAGVAVAEIARRPARRSVAAALACLYAVGLYVANPPRGGQRYRVRAAAELRSSLLERRPERGPVLELPMNVPPAPPGTPWPGVLIPILVSTGYQARAMFRSIFHWRPLLNGYRSYWPLGFPERMALAERLPDADALHELRVATGLESVVVNTADLAPPARAEWLALTVDGGRPDLRFVASQDGELLFEVR